ncbi:SusD/RagB family nutrient-binding outer membrane lipoprotein [Hymenobacter terrestris]|uniref:SusD/RagB family nutrient-binding outer membrane lipoprotein n=1 Tax=Hymenobacter terrestris TaxID=2748310 RepID=A0ABX2Q3K8_9BACT|nr:SusD/RagB family nutrient-binding outer membrane lipoprotein [Hymenobacter terrestris]NVO85553.1 SusD/RagB family nutrient-binding outer membrane lipoprotein [Hymenobacter terrestris]
MKSFAKLLLAAVLTTGATGCESFLDINDNPNQAISVTPDAMLASALATTAANYHGGPTNYNTYSSFAVGHWTKSGTVSGFNEEQTYNYTNIYYQGLFSNTYDNLTDYNIIQENGTAQGFPNHAAIARIMKVYNFLLLVDQYGDIPYSQALQGAANTTPTYDKAADIYKDFVVQLKGALTDIDAATAGRKVGAEDIVFQGNMTKWKQFANSLRLRILLRESQTNDAALNTYVATEMATLQASAGTTGFITADVVAQPGYASNSGQQNPFYNRYGFAVGAINATNEYSFVIPTQYVIDQYESNKDPRITELYRVGKRENNPAYVGGILGQPSPPTFVSTNSTVGSRFLQGGTFLRGGNAPTVLMLLAEHHFSKAEAHSRGLFTGGATSAEADFNDGIKASFLFTYRAAGTAPTTLAAASAATPGISQYNTYISTNLTNPLVNYKLAPINGTLGRQQVIIYQKYLAENTVASTEAWDDYRRTGLPNIPLSLRVATKRAVRLIYPQSEISTNQANVPKDTDQFMKIFWDVVD